MSILALMRRVMIAIDVLDSLTEKLCKQLHDMPVNQCHQMPHSGSQLVPLTNHLFTQVMESEKKF